MDAVSGVVLYILLWWWVFFMTLPFGARGLKNPEKGQVASAPEKPRLGLKMLMTSLIAMLLWGCAWLIIEAGWFSFRDWARIDARN